MSRTRYTDPTPTHHDGAVAVPEPPKEDEAMDQFRRKPPMEGFSRPGSLGGEAFEDDEVEGHIMTDKDDDTEGHAAKRSLTDDDDTAGHAAKTRSLTDDDDTAGHATTKRT